MKKKILLLFIITVFIVCGYILFSQTAKDIIELRFQLKKAGSKEYVEKELVSDKSGDYKINEKLNMNDKYKIILKSKIDGYLAIFNINSEGDYIKLYPLDREFVKISAWKSYVLPKPSDAFTFDDSPGSETMMFMFGENKEDILNPSKAKKGKLKVINLKLETITTGDDVDDDTIDSDIITFEDENFENAVRELIGKKLLDITKSDVKMIEEANFVEKKISNIQGIEYFENLRELALDYNYIEDISPLENLTKLEVLDLRGNEIKDIQVLKNLRNLTYLSLTENFVRDITPLSELTKLESLLLYRNQISDISPLENLTELELLSLPLNKLVNIYPLSNLYNLKELYLHTNQISDISPLENLTELEILHLSYNDYIEDISPLSEMKDLQELYLYQNDIKDITPLSEMNKLTKLVLGDNDIEDISTLKTIYENGGLQRGSELLITNNNMNLKPYSDNRDIVNYLIGKGVIIEYESGNKIR